MKKIYITIALLLFTVLYADAQYPIGFVEETVAAGINKPFAFAFAPDGRIFVTEQTGKIRIIKNGALLTQAFTTVPVYYSGEFGLLGIALDPSFNTNHYVYVYYTIPGGDHNRISRFTASGDTAVPGSETALFNFEPLDLTLNFHNAGSLHFGPDGKLYLSTGENGHHQLSQDLTSYKGKILRLNSDGTIPIDNPFNTGSAARRSIWVYGLRNPFSFTFQKGTNKLFVNDVGADTWEEINDGTVSGRNFGWPNAEGNGSNPSYTNPVYTYQHGTGDGFGCAITGGAFYNPDSVTYPLQYVGRYFYIDHCAEYINMLDFSGGVTTRMPFATGIKKKPIYLELGPDGNLYFLSRGKSSLARVVYTGNTYPTITDQPVSKLVGLNQSVKFEVEALGANPIHYQWYHNNIPTGVDSNALNISNVQYADTGKFFCMVYNAYATIYTDTVTLTVQSSNNSPVGIVTVLNQPFLYKGGDTIRYIGSATDAEDGVINKTTFNWVIEWHHHTHTHPGPAVPQHTDTGSFVIPFTTENDSEIYVGINLITTDADGNIDTATANVYPDYKTLHFTSVPSGLSFNLNGNLVKTPVDVASINNVNCEIEAITPQYILANQYTFTQYGTGQTNPALTFRMPAHDTSATALFVLKYRDGENPAGVSNGLYYDVYNGAWDSLPQYDLLIANATGTTTNFNLNVTGNTINYSIVYSGFISVPADDNYSFYTNSDDGSRFWIGDRLVVDNNGIHALSENSGTIALKAGKHLFRLEYLQGGGNAELEVYYSSSAISKQLIPANKLYRYRNNITVNANHDAYVRGGVYAATKFGKTDPLVLKAESTTGSPDNFCETYLMFNLSKLTSHFNSASVKLYGVLKGNDKINPVRIEVLPLNNVLWKENTITFTNRPLTSETPLDTIAISDSVGNTYSWDITENLKQLIKQKKTYASFVIRSIDTFDSYIDFNSAENSANKARIVLSYPPPRMMNGDVVSDDNPFQDLSIIPNPFKTSFTISFYSDEDKPNADFELTDITGRLIWHKQMHIIAGENEIEVQVNDISKGIYLLTLRQPQGIITRRVEVE
ncbi:MAG: PQQ-dependent sugar dehydrogenase [Bacteroidia bacterium]